MVEIGIKTVASSRRAVFALNTNCLTQGGCVSVADLLPTVWAKTEASSRRAVFALNTNCLTQGGCVSVADLLPTVWAKTADEKIACRIPTDKGWVQRPAPWWP